MCCLATPSRTPLFFIDPVPADLPTLSLPDALPILEQPRARCGGRRPRLHRRARGDEDRKSTRLNSSHVAISYAVFCLKKKNAIICLKQTRIEQAMMPPTTAKTQNQRVTASILATAQ